ncbi:MAG TPA: hypothetical protein GXX59_10285 [Syntrophomonadaceae bacterium]|nr:hypothetical protein [Syntrophomonadaceae bacterium]
MRTRLCVFVCSCLIALGLIGCFTPEEAATSITPSKTYGEVKKPETKKEVTSLDNAMAVVPVRDPFVPLIVASAPSEGQTDTESGETDTDNSEGKRKEPNAKSNVSQKITIELAAVYQQGERAYASLRDGKQMADVTVGETFSGYEVTKIDFRNNQITLKKDGQIVVIKNCSPTK